MPMFWGDYLRDTGHLSAGEHGAYLLLIAHQWTTAKPLLDDNDRLARIACMSSREWKSARKIIEEFFIVADGLWSNKRVVQELGIAQAKYVKAQKAGRASARTRNEHGLDPSSTGVETKTAPPLEPPEPEPKPEPLTTLKEVVDFVAVCEESSGGDGGNVQRETHFEGWLDLANSAAALAEFEKDFTQHTGMARQWFADGVKTSDLLVIPTVLARERAKRALPALVLPLSYYTGAVMQAMRERLTDLGKNNDLRGAIDKWKRGDDAA